MSTNDQPIDLESAFAALWDEVEARFAERAQKFPEFVALENLIKTLRAQGYAAQLRASTSLFWFVLSRARGSVLRREQPRLQIAVALNGGMTLIYRKGDHMAQTDADQIALTAELQALLDQLVQEPVD